MKKSLSVLSLLFGLFVCVTAFSACGGDDNEKVSPASNPLVGTWWIRYIEKGKYHSYEELTFNADFTCSWAEYNEDDGLKLSSSDTGTYKVDGNTLTIWYNNSSKPWTTEFSIKGNQLVFPPDSATDGIWTKK